MRSNHYRRCSALVFACLSVLLISPTGTFASDPEIPKGVGPIPDFAKGERGGAIVTSQHIQSYRVLLPPEVAALVDQGELVFEVVKGPRDKERFERASLSQGELDSSGALRSVLPSPLPAGLFAVNDGIIGDQKQQAFKILWNVASAMWPYRSFRIGFSAYLFQRADAAPKKLEFLLERIHPLSLGGAPGALKPVFREKISAQKPVAIQGLSWLTLRFFGLGEDFVWVASPVVRAIREITGSNRSDLLFSGTFSPDDLLVWSGKVELAEPTALAHLSVLVPIVEGKDPVSTQGDGCTERVFGGDGAISLQCQSSRFKGASGWIPTNTMFVPRNVWKIDFASRDPFSTEPRQSLYIDQDTGQPVYRVVWDQAGRLKKVSIGILRALEGDAGHRDVVIGGQSIIYAQEARRVALVYESFSSCNQYGPGHALDDFDPATFVRFEPKPALDKKLAVEPKSEDSLD